MNERFVRDNSRKKKEEEEQKGVRKNVNQTNETHLTTLGLTEQERVVAQRSSIPILAGHPSSSHRNTETEPRPNASPPFSLILVSPRQPRISRVFLTSQVSHGSCARRKSEIN